MISSGADHARVAASNPHWSVNDWCWYWHRDLEKALKKNGIEGTPEVVTDCGDECVCRSKL